VPLVKVSARGWWSPSWWRRTLHPTGENYVTRELVRQLPWKVARIISHTGRTIITEDEVLVTIEQTHPYSVNAKDVWIKLEVGQQLSSKRDVLLDALERAIGEMLDDLCSSKTGRPVVDVDVVFVDITGFSLDTRGVRTISW